MNISNDNSGGSNSNGYSVGYVNDKEWIKYTVDIQQEGYYNIETAYAANESGGKLYYELNDVLITPAVTFNSTGSFSNFSTKTTERLTWGPGKSTLLTDTKFENLVYALPSFIRQDDWYLLFCMSEQGTSIDNWYKQVKGHERTILLV